MNLPWVYMCSPFWTPFPPPSPYHLSGSSQYTSPKHPISCIEPGLLICFIYDIIHVSMPFSPIIPPSSSPTESKSLFYTSMSLLELTKSHYHQTGPFHYFLKICMPFQNYLFYLFSFSSQGEWQKNHGACSSYIILSLIYNSSWPKLDGL